MKQQKQQDKPYLSLLFLYTKMCNVAGLSTSEAQKSADMFMKGCDDCRISPASHRFPDD